MDDPTWLILFRAEQPPQTEAVVDALRSIRGVRARAQDDLVLVEDLETGATVEIAVSAEPHVLEEAREIAELATSKQAAASAASCNMRFEVGWPLWASAELTNTLCLIGDALTEFAGGPAFIFDPRIGEFV